ncbi:hypothetical protein ILUMI_20764 [Ignelater luminosus]|uniref:G domain-containing protein n=1 Tax=Ignelater luminosus TaxID=2038154 RepID=A0A8K0G4A4_IGNLU|nr:hypothetical protein ILUMI_20764 [Ignelater luminosus]
MVNPSKKLQEDILNVLRNSDDLLKEFRRKIENKYVIIFIGNTRNGKSTLVNYIMGASLVSFQEGDVFRIKQKSDVNLGPTIGHGSLSHTTVPTVLPLQDKPDTVIVDAPGFDDNRGVLQEIINALYINQIKYSKGVRFVLISDINNIVNDNINNFLSFIDTVRTIMPDFIKLRRAVSIIFTKDSGDHSLDEIVEILAVKILNVSSLYCEKELIHHFVEQKDLIGLFRMPTKTGDLTEEININVEGAIFKSLPINLSETDIRFGLSKNARVALLETYLEFFDVVISLKEKFKMFRIQAMNKFCGLKREKLLGLSNEQLCGEGSAEEIIQQFYKEVEDDEEQIYVVSDIPDSLKKIFIDDVNEVMSCLSTIGVDVPNESDLMNLNTIEEIQNELEYLACIEIVVEKDDKSKNIIKCYSDNSQAFQDDLKGLWRSIKKEMQTRDDLAFEIRSLPLINNCLLELSESYLFASMRDELISMKDSLERSVQLCNSIFSGISERPHTSQMLQQEVRETFSIPGNINTKLSDINRHIYQRDKEIFLENVSRSVKGILSTLAVCTGIGFLCIDGYSRLKIATATGSFLLFALFLCKSTNAQTLFMRFQRRYQQKRGLFRSRLKLDSYWRDLGRRRFNIH